MLDLVTKEVIERSEHDGRASGVGNMDYPLVPMEKEIADYTPVGDAAQAIRAAGDALNGHLGKAVLRAGLLFVPNSIEKAAKPVIQSFKGGASRALRHAPARTIDYDDALLRPYKGQNFVHHDIDGEYVRDVLHGETRLMSPSLAVNRWGDYNDIYTPGFYGDHVLIGDRSMLENSRLFNGDGMTPTVREVWYGMDSVPSDMREKVSDDIWRLMERENVGKNVITDVKDLEHLDLPFSDQYFEAKYHGTYPIENFRYGVFPEPVDSVGEKVLREFEKRGLPIKTYKQVGGNEGYNNKVEAMLKVLNENQGLLFKCGGKKYPGGGKFFRTNLQQESPLMYQPMVDINYPVETPLRFRPQPDLGDYRAPESTGMIVNYPVPAPREAIVEVPATGYGVSLPAESSVSVIDPRKDAAKRIMAVENSKASASGGWDAKTSRWYPHKSIEGGADTIAYGIKLSNGTPEAALALKQGYLTDEQAVSAVDSLVQKYYDAAKRVYDGKYGAGEWDKLSDKSQSILVDYSYNPGLAKFPKLMEGFHSGNLDLIRKNYKRYSGGKELGRNKVLLEELDTLENEYPIFRKNGGSIHIAPSKRGTFTAAAKKHGKSVQAFASQVLAHKENYSPAMVKKANFARNAAKWHAEGGLLQRYSPEQIKAAISKIRK